MPTFSDEYDLPSAPSGAGHDDPYGGVPYTAPLDVVYAAWHEAYREGRFDVPDQRTPDVDGLYDHARSLVADRHWSWNLIEEELSCLNGGFYDGLFVSALINTHEEDRITLSRVPDAKNPDHGTGKIGHVGYRNTKDIVIQDDAGTHTGVRMEDGSITVHGDTGRSTGKEMTGGRIHVYGDVDSGPGRKMRGGVLTVEGNIRNEALGMEDAGYSMAGGEMHVHGDIHGNAGRRMQGGAIHVHGDIHGSIGLLGDDGVIKQEQDGEPVQVWPEDEG